MSGEGRVYVPESIAQWGTSLYDRRGHWSVQDLYVLFEKGTYWGGTVLRVATGRRGKSAVIWHESFIKRDKKGAAFDALPLLSLFYLSVTFTLQMDLLPLESVAVIMVLPFALAVTFPAAFTVATSVLEEV